MGKSSKIGCCVPIGSCLGAGGSASNLNLSSGQELSALVQDLMQRLQADPIDVNKFKAILTFIDQELERRRKCAKWNVEVPGVINGNVEDAEKTFLLIYNLCKDKDGKAHAQIELQRILSDAFGGLGTLHWITVAFSMVAFVMKRVENTRTNKETSLDLLEKVQELGHKLVDLFEVAPNRNNEFWQIGSSIIEVAIFCIKELNASYLRRFTFVNVRMGDVSKFKEEIPHLYQRLILIMEEENARRAALPMASYEPEDPHIVGREEMINYILGVMEEVPQTCQAILLHGLGGIGKTTIADKIIAECRGRYQSIAQTEVGEKPTSQMICNCQAMLLERLSGSRQNIQASSEGRRLLYDHFKNVSLLHDYFKNSNSSAPILLFIDNVFLRDDLEDLLPRELFSVLPENSCILVTSRDARVSDAFRLSGVKWKECPVDGLKKPDAEALLMRHLGRVPKDRRGKLDAVLDVCNGWPLAIEVVGSHLGRYKEDDNTWKSTITQLRKCKSVSNDSADVLKMILEWSYNQMDEDSRNIFLDISCLLRYREWSWVEALGTGSEVKALEARSLLKHVTKSALNIKRHEHHVEVHDLLVALGEQKSSEANRARRVYTTDGSLPSILEDDDYEQGELEHVQGLALTAKRGRALSAKKLDAMAKNLRILLLNPWGGHVEGKCEAIPKNLQICATRGFPYRGLKGLKDLRVLSIDGGDVDIKDVDIKFDVEILPGTLQFLRLWSIVSLASFHENAFQNCSGLDTVDISFCRQLKELPASICGIRTMRDLRLNDNGLRTLPPGLKGMEGLEHFECRSCPLEEFPSAIADLKKLRTLSLKHFRALPRSVDLSHLSQLMHLDLDFDRLRTRTDHWVHGFGELCTLQTLRITNWWSLTRLYDDFSNLTALQELSLTGCKSLTQLPEGLQNLHALAVLDLSECRGFGNLPDAIFHLSSLKKLILTRCTSLLQLPDKFHKLLVLSELNLEGCTALRSLPESFSQLASLEILRLDKCTSLREMPRGFGNLLRLSYLTIKEADSLGQMPDGFSQLLLLRTLIIPARCLALTGISPLKSLQYLTVKDCETLTRLPAGFENLSSLESLTLSECKSLTELPSGFGNLSSLKTLTLTRCESLSELPSGFENLSSLKTLGLYKCESLTDLPSGFGKLVRLRGVTLQGCKSLREFPDEVGSLLAVKRLLLTGCENLQQLPDSLCRLKNLQMLTLEGSFEELPENFGDLSALESLKLSCLKLRELPCAVGNLLALRDLNLKGCHNLQQLPEFICGLTNLRSLDLGTGIEKLSDNIGDLSALESLKLSCPKLRELPCTVENLLALRELKLKGCHDLQQLPKSICGFTNLRSLDLGIGIEKLSDNIGDLSALESLKLSCPKLRELPCTVENLLALRDLKLKGCHDLQQLPESICGLTNLKSLDLGTGIEKLSDNIRDLSALESLKLSCPKLRELPCTMGNLLALRDLKLGGCHDLQQLPESIYGLTNLRSLDLGTGIEKLPDNVEDLSALESLKLSCSKLRGLPHTMGNLLALRDLNLKGCHNLQQLPESICGLTNLRSLDLGKGIEKLLDNVGDLSALESLKLSCPKLRELPCTMENLLALRDLKLEGCHDLQQLPKSICGLMNLRSLDLEGCRYLGTGNEKLPDNIGDLSALESLKLSCPKLRELPCTMGNLLALRDLKLEGCHDLQQLPESIYGLTNLRLLELGIGIEKLSDNVGDLSALKSLKLSCPKLRGLPHIVGNLLALRDLNLKGCHDLQQLPESICGLMNLRSLDLGTGIEKLPDNVGDLCSLKYLTLTPCRKLAALPESMLQLKPLPYIYLGVESELRQSEVIRQLEAQNAGRIIVLPAAPSPST